MNLPVTAHHRSTSAPLVLRADVDDIAVLTVNRPQARNSLSAELLAALGEALTVVGCDRAIRVVVLAASGPVFSAGHDLKEMRARRADPDGGVAFFKQVFELCSAVMLQIVRLPQPVIAAVQGTATAAGCQLVASCDLAIASEAATFATPGVNIGLFCSTPMVALSRNVARKHALEMLLTGDAVSAAQAQAMGLVNHVVAQGTEREAALALGRKIAAKSTHVVKLGKAAFYRQLEMELASAYDFAGKVMVDNMLARDAEEGISAFVEKRTPQWDDC
jgi:enoyl-CoA hydratase/carnithine racemase